MGTTRADLEAAVVAAALAERRAGLAMNKGHLHESPPGTERAWLDALSAYEAATDALLAFYGEEASEDAETQARLKAHCDDVMEADILRQEDEWWGIAGMKTRIPRGAGDE